jgi:hypothetical protein
MCAGGGQVAVANQDATTYQRSDDIQGRTLIQPLRDLGWRECVVPLQQLDDLPLGSR